MVLLVGHGRVPVGDEGIVDLTVPVVKHAAVVVQERVVADPLEDRAVLLAQAPILGLLMWAVFPAPDPAAMFVLVLSCLWFGASASVRCAPLRVTASA